MNVKEYRHIFHKMYILSVYIQKIGGVYASAHTEVGQ